MDYLDCPRLRENYFKNPDKVPINELFLKYETVKPTSKDSNVSVDDALQELEDGRALKNWKDQFEIIVERKPAIDACWLVEGEIYVPFQSYYPQFSAEQNDSFLESNYKHLQCLSRLLECSYHEFWCHIVCKPDMANLILQFLEHSVSPFVISHMNEEFLDLYNEIYSNVFNIYRRLLEFKISNIEYMSEETAVQYLKRTDLLSVRSILLLCYLYNHTQPGFIRKIINLYFKEKYKDDYIQELTQLLTDVLGEMDRLERGNSIKLEGLRFGGGFDITKFSKTKDLAWLETTSFYVLEMMSSLQEFFCMCKPAVEIAVELEIPYRLGHAYQQIYNELYNVLERQFGTEDDQPQLQILINEWIPCGREQFVAVFHGFTCHLIDKVLGSKGDHEGEQKCLESYIELISTVLEDHAFIMDYHKVHPLDGHFKVLIDNALNFDKTQADYFLGILNEIPVEDTLDYRVPNKQQTKPVTLSECVQKSFPQHQYEVVLKILTQYEEQIKDIVSEGQECDLEDLPTHVANAIRIFWTWKRLWEDNPNRWTFSSKVNKDEGDELQRLMEEEQNQQQGHEREGELYEDFQFEKPDEETIERNIQTVLGMFPDLGAGFILKCLERMDYRPELVISRILDNDLPSDLAELPRDLARGASVPQRMPGTSRAIQGKPAPKKFIAYIGKKPGYSDAKELLDDRKEKEDIKNIVLKASYAYEIDEDYDDRNAIYDPFENGDENKIYRHVKLENMADLVEKEESSSSSGSDTESKPPRDAFCENPEIIRARREEQRAKRDAQRGRNYRDPGGKQKGWNREKGEKNTQPAKNENADQNQEKKKEQDRHKKNVNKSSRGNHNRKGGAQWKRNKGMIPS